MGSRPHAWSSPVGVPLLAVNQGPWGCLSLTRCWVSPALPRSGVALRPGGLLEGVGELCGGHLARAGEWHLRVVAGRDREVKSEPEGGTYSQLSLKLTENLLMAREKGWTELLFFLSVNSLPEPNFLHVKAPGHGAILQGFLIPRQSPLLPRWVVL